jgi:hypothetical protein
VQTVQITDGTHSERASSKLELLRFQFFISKSSVKARPSQAARIPRKGNTHGTHHSMHQAGQRS